MLLLFRVLIEKILYLICRFVDTPLYEKLRGIVVTLARLLCIRYKTTPH